MSLLDSEAGKRRLLTVEIPVIERYNEGRDPAFRIRVHRVGGALVLALLPQTGTQCLPAGNSTGKQLSDGAAGDARSDGPETLPALAGRPDALPVAAGQHAPTSRWDPARFTCIFAIQAAWRWLACYEIWHETGEWPLPEAK